MPISVSLDMTKIAQADCVYFSCAVNLKNLWISALYENFLYKKNGIEDDLLLILKDKSNRCVMESLLFDELDYILDHLVIETDRVFRQQVKQEFRLLSREMFLISERYPIYTPNGHLPFQSLEFVDPKTIGLFKIKPSDIEGR